jgi:hypothetical protein
MAEKLKDKPKEGRARKPEPMPKKAIPPRTGAPPRDCAEAPAPNPSVLDERKT